MNLIILLVTILFKHIAEGKKVLVIQDSSWTTPKLAEKEYGNPIFALLLNNANNLTNNTKIPVHSQIEIPKIQDCQNYFGAECIDWGHSNKRILVGEKDKKPGTIPLGFHLYSIGGALPPRLPNFPSLQDLYQYRGTFAQLVRNSPIRIGYRRNPLAIPRLQRPFYAPVGSQFRVKMPGYNPSIQIRNTIEYQALPNQPNIELTPTPWHLMPTGHILRDMRYITPYNQMTNVYLQKTLGNDRDIPLRRYPMFRIQDYGPLRPFSMVLTEYNLRHDFYWFTVESIVEANRNDWSTHLSHHFMDVRWSNQYDTWQQRTTAEVLQARDQAMVRLHRNYQTLPTLHNRRFRRDFRDVWVVRHYLQQILDDLLLIRALDQILVERQKIEAELGDIIKKINPRDPEDPEKDEERKSNEFSNIEKSTSNKSSGKLKDVKVREVQGKQKKAATVGESSPLIDELNFYSDRNFPSINPVPSYLPIEESDGIVGSLQFYMVSLLYFFAMDSVS